MLQLKRTAWAQGKLVGARTSVPLSHPHGTARREIKA